MKRLTTALTLGYITLANAVPAFAQTGGGAGTSQNITPAQGPQGIAGNTTPATIIRNSITIVYVAGILLVLAFLVIGAFNWITSGGDKEKIKSARGTIVHALVGLAILALAFVILTVAGNILNIQWQTLSIPGLGS